MGCSAETLATFRQFQADGGFAIPTTDLAAYNALLDADSTGLLMHEHETQVLHGLWKSTRIDDAGAEVGPGWTHHLSTCRTPFSTPLVRLIGVMRMRDTMPALWFPQWELAWPSMVISRAGMVY